MGENVRDGVRQRVKYGVRDREKKKRNGLAHMERAEETIYLCLRKISFPRLIRRLFSGFLHSKLPQFCKLHQLRGWSRLYILHMYM